ncbi:hypothetical protein H9Y04_41345 [Streptomyces sp. TRM66268-LWL]|uniref:Uncharacterized protein n=1 Tax=Streptomyces polyasparticus TaxID=2767826 RepID=A0ABR7SWL6_9ACTN|nr:hypothetical protein [Streptomyces polyasparticus]MBC9718992.1 hypothetical protein [Streptomyces polyasparticus]
MTDRQRGRWLEIADIESARLGRWLPGEPYGGQERLRKIYRTNAHTARKVIEELEHRGIIRRVATVWGHGRAYVSTGRGVLYDGDPVPKLPEHDLNAIAQIWHTDTGYCPVCWGPRSGLRHTVWGYACARCVRIGKVLTDT